VSVGYTLCREDVHETEESMHVTTRVGLLVIALAVALAVVAFPAVAQNQQADTMQMVRDKIRADKKLLIAENLPLTESEAKAFWPVYEKYQKEMSALNDRMIKLIKEYANNYETMSEQTAKRLMDEYLAIDAARLKIRQAYVPRFRKVLREKLVARYYQLENKVQAAVSYELAAEIPLVK
jgi:flagellar biosynthesis/type III secretory pathway protein FliH